MPKVGRDPNCQTNHEGQDGYALVDAAELAALRLNDARYRWLKAQFRFKPDMDSETRSATDGSEGDGWWYIEAARGETLDAAIDAAREAT